MNNKGLFGLGKFILLVYLAGAVFFGYLYSSKLKDPEQDNTSLFLYSLLAFLFVCAFVGDLYVRFSKDKQDKS